MPNIYKFLLFCCPYIHDYLSVRCSRVTTVNALKKIGYIGPVPECSTGNKTLIFHIPYTTENFQTIQNPYILLSFCLYVHYDAVSLFRNDFIAFVCNHQISTTFGRNATHCASQKRIGQGRQNVPARLWVCWSAEGHISSSRIDSGTTSTSVRLHWAVSSDTGVLIITQQLIGIIGLLWRREKSSFSADYLNAFALDGDIRETAASCFNRIGDNKRRVSKSQ